MERYGYEENLKLWRGQLDEAKDEQGRPPGHFFLSLQVGLMTFHNATIVADFDSPA